jgi:Ca2+-binding EF-hand superfamily protein
MTSLQSSQASTNYKEAFSLFDKRGTGRVALESLGDLLRACGQNPTLAEIRDLEKQAGGDCERCFFTPMEKVYSLTAVQSTLTPSLRSLTDPTVSAIQASPKNTAAASKFSTRT